MYKIGVWKSCSLPVSRTSNNYFGSVRRRYKYTGSIKCAKFVQTLIWSLREGFRGSAECTAEIWRVRWSGWVGGWVGGWRSRCNSRRVYTPPGIRLLYGGEELKFDIFECCPESGGKVVRWKETFGGNELIFMSCDVEFWIAAMYDSICHGMFSKWKFRFRNWINSPCDFCIFLK